MQSFMDEELDYMLSVSLPSTVHKIYEDDTVEKVTHTLGYE